MDVTERFSVLLARPEPEVRLDEASLLIAAHAHPGLDVDAQRGRLDRLADACRTPTLDGLVRHLFVDEAFRGNDVDYHDPRNSYLDEVLDRRIGIPISLCVLTIEVGRRIGVPVAGVGMPGHFLLRDKVDHGVFVDPFRRGALLDRVGCEQVFHLVNGPDAPFDPTCLEPVGARTIVARMLANLKMIFAQRGDGRSLAWALALRCQVPGMPVGEFSEWAEALAAIGRFDEAANVLERVAPGLEGARQEAWLSTASSLRARLN